MKQILRQKLKTVRDNLDEDYRKTAEIVINNYIIKLMIELKANNIAAYYPVNSEVNILEALKLLSIPISLPAISGDKLDFIRWNTNEQLVLDGKFPYPKGSITINPEIILLPAVAYDQSGARLGYGLGYYDKTLPNYSNATKIIIAFSKQKILEIPIETHDIRADYIITEEGIFKCQPMNN